MTVSDIIKLLEKKDLIERKTSQFDSRAKVGTLTGQGLAITKKTTKIVQEIDLTFFGLLGSNETQFLSFLKQLV